MVHLSSKNRPSSTALREPDRTLPARVQGARQVDKAAQTDTAPTVLDADAPTVAPGLVTSKNRSTQGGRLTSQVSTLRSGASPASFLNNQKQIDAAEFVAATGIDVTDEEAAQLDQLVKDVAKSLGLDHEVGFARETDFMTYYRFTFIGTFKAWDRPNQKILVGLGIKAGNADHLTAFGDIAPSFERVAEDFVSMTVRERIETVLVHEKAELDALRMGASDPHRVAVEQAPDTDAPISARARQHLALYAQVDRAMFGPVR